VVVDPAELADDGGQGRPDDRLVQGGQQDPGHQATHEQQDLPLGQARWYVVGHADKLQIKAGQDHHPGLGVVVHGAAQALPAGTASPSQVSPRRAAASLIIGPTSVASSHGSPVRSAATLATTASSSASKRASGTNTRCTAMQLCPAW